MRTARFAPDGAIAVGVHHDSQSTRYFSTWQATPWLETTLSYFDDAQGSLGVDRSLDVKVRLLTEGDYRPQLAIGIQDALGTGRLGSEYIVASKRYYDFDFTMGFAWGYLGSRGGIANMFRLFSDSFDQRSATASSGGIRTGSYFSGHDMSFFAGAEYHPPVKGLSFKIEYSSVDTMKYVGFSHLKRDTAFNLGVNYKPTSWADVALGYDRGNQFSIRLTLKQNFHTLKFKKPFREPDPAPIMERSDAAGPDGRLLPLVSKPIGGNDRVFDRLRRLGVTVTGIEQALDNTIVRVQSEKTTDAHHLTVLGVLLEHYDRVTLYIDDHGPEIQIYAATKSDIVGQAAVDKFRRSSVYLREQTAGTGGAILANSLARSAYRVLEKADLSPVSVSLEARRVTVRKKAGPYFNEVKNIGRVARILTREMPDNIEVFDVTTEAEGLEVSRVSLLRRDLEKANSYQGSPAEIWVNTKVFSPGHEEEQKDVNVADSYSPGQKQKFGWGLKPEVLTHFGGNENGRFRADVYAKLFGSLKIGSSLSLSAEFRQFIVGDIDRIPPDLQPNVPKVRSDIARYAREGRSALERVKLDYTSQIGRDLYGRLTVGLLESMYGGVAAEILYRPYRRNFALGVDLSWVKQRAFDQLFSFRNYDVLTGHATVYHENTNYNITSKLSAGRYLAGDYGATLDISRRFSNGVRIGAWATVTDMSSDDFGDGSFDKGIYLTMPLEIFWYQPTREKMQYKFRSLGKNGGQMLDRGQGLYDTLFAGRRNRLAHDWREILD